MTALNEFSDTSNLIKNLENYIELVKGKDKVLSQLMSHFAVSAAKQTVLKKKTTKLGAASSMSNSSNLPSSFLTIL